jgi:hypothetical protein
MSEASKPVLIAERRAAERYGVSWRTLWRWDERPELEFPPVIKIAGRRFRELAALEAWERERAKRAAAKAARPRQRPRKGAQASPEL